MENQEKWRRYEDKIKAKRDINTNRKKKPNEEVRKLRRDELIVQRLSATVSGKAQIFSRIGPREFVPYPLDDLTVRGIKDACLSHFGRRSLVEWSATFWQVSKARRVKHLNK
jgi:hypothetical protein